MVVIQPTVLLSIATMHRVCSVCSSLAHLLFIHIFESFIELVARTSVILSVGFDLLPDDLMAALEVVWRLRF